MIRVGLKTEGLEEKKEGRKLTMTGCAVVTQVSVNAFSYNGYENRPSLGSP